MVLRINEQKYQNIRLISIIFKLNFYPTLFVYLPWQFRLTTTDIIKRWSYSKYHSRTCRDLNALNTVRLHNVSNVSVTGSISAVNGQISQGEFLRRVIAAKLKSDRARKRRYLIIKKKPSL